MYDTVKVVEQRHTESSTPILKNSAIVPLSQCETGETKGSTEDAKDKALAKDGVKEGKVGSRSGHTTSSSRNLHTTVVVLFVKVRPST